MSKYEDIYLRLPIFLQNILCSLEGLRIQYTRFNKEFYRYLKEAEERSSWSRDQLFEYRDKRLREFIMYASNNVPYYRKKFREWGIDPRSIRSVEDLRNIPILTKDEVKKNFTEFISETVPKSKLVWIHTSGTTGGGFKFYTTKDSIWQQWAIWWRYRRWHRIPLNGWYGNFGTRYVVPITQKKPPFWRYDIPGKRVYFSAYHMNKENLYYYIKEINKRKLLWLHGYPSLISLLASFILESNLHLGYNVKWVTTGAENLMEHQAEVIRRAFGVKPIQHYGLTEAVANISECVEGFLHVDEDFSAVEFVPLGSGTYKLIGTNFTNFAMPFLRYDTGDIVRIDENIDRDCNCGFRGRIVNSIDGRKEDYVILRDGRKIGKMDHIFKDLVNIREAQIYQDKPGEIYVRVVKGDKYNLEDEKALLRELKKTVGEDTKIIVEYIDSLARTPSGKLRFIVSDIKEGKIDFV